MSLLGPSSPPWGNHFPAPLSEQYVFVGDERLHHQSLVSDVVERRHGVQVGRSHQRRPEDDAQVLAGHEVLLPVLRDPERREGEGGQSEPAVTQPGG